MIQIGFPLKRTWNTALEMLVDQFEANKFEDDSMVIAMKQTSSPQS